MALGIFLAFLGTILQLVSYLLSRAFLAGAGRSPWQLMNLSHVIVGACSLAMLALILPSVPAMPDWGRFWLPFLLSGGLYFGGQICFLLALSKAEASRLAPFLGLKVVILALLMLTLRGAVFSGTQWLAVGCSAVAAVLVNWTGGKLPGLSLGLILLAAFGYAASDMFMKDMIEICSVMGGFARAGFPMCMEYLLCGSVGLVWLVLARGFRRDSLLPALAPSLLWMAAMLAMFSSFGLISVVYANIIQSSRGVLSILVGAAVAAMGFGTVESKVGWAPWSAGPSPPR